jgi:hypothetical protein
MMTENMGRALGLEIKARKRLHHLVSAVAFRWLATSAIVISDPSGHKCAALVTTNVELHGAPMSGNLREGPQATTNHAYDLRNRTMRFAIGFQIERSYSPTTAAKMIAQ